MNRSLILILIVAGVCWTSESLACSCLAADTRYHYETADTVFSGLVTDIEDRTGTLTERVTFAVNNSYKGAQGASVTLEVLADTAGCGYVFRDGQPYIVFAKMNEAGQLTTDLCSGTAEYLPETERQLVEIQDTPGGDLKK